MALSPIVVTFATAGIPEVRNAFAQVRAQAAKFEEGMVASAEKGGRQRVGLADREAREKIKLQQKVDREVEKAIQDSTRAQEKEAKRRQDIVRRSAEMAGRDAVKAAREEAREIERIEEQKMRAKVRGSEMAARAAAREAAEEIKIREKVAKSAGGYAKTWGGRIGGAAMAVGSVVGIGGAFALADSMRKEMSDEKIAAQLVNQVTTGARPPDGATVKNILGQAGAVSRETGIDRGDITQAGLVYAQNARRGDFKGTMGNMGFIAKLSKVTGTNMNELAEAAGTLQSQNADLGPEQMQQLLLNAYAQSKQGSMSLTDAAKSIGIMGSTRSSFAGDVTANQRTLIGLGQIARAGGDAGEAGTFVKDIALEAGKADAKYFRETKKATGKGEHLFKTDEHGRFESPEDLVTSVIRKTGGNIQVINDLMGVRGGALFRELEGSYIQGAGKKNDVEAGIRAVQANMREVTGATMTAGDLDAQFKQTMDQPAEKFSSAMNKIQESMMEHFAPALDHLADKLSDPAVETGIDTLISAVSKVVDFLVDNPFKGVAALVGATIMADLAKAAIGSGIKAILEQSLKGALGGALGGGGIGGGVGTGGKVVGAAAAGIAAAAGTIALIDSDVDDQAKANASQALRGGQAVATAASIGKKIKSGKVTASDVASIQQQAADAERRQRELAKGPASSFTESAASVVGYLTGQGKGVNEMLAVKQQENARALKEATDEVNLLKKAANAAAAALSSVKTAAPGAVPPVTSNSPSAPIGHDTRARAG